MVTSAVIRRVLTSMSRCALPDIVSGTPMTLTPAVCFQIGPLLAIEPVAPLPARMLPVLVRLSVLPEAIVRLAPFERTSAFDEALSAALFWIWSVAPSSVQLPAEQVMALLLPLKTLPPL